MPTLTGLFPVLTTPFNSDNQIDLNALRLHVNALLPFVSGFVIGGTTGESGSLSDNEILSIMQAVKTTAPEKIIIAGFWRPTINLTRVCAQAVTTYADALLIPIPKELFHAEDAAIENFYLNLAQCVTSNILLYNYPSRCEHHAISATLADKLATQSKQIIGVKDSSEDASLAFEIISKNLPLQALVGNDRYLYQMLYLLNQSPDAKYPAASVSGACSVPEIAMMEAEIYNKMKTGNASEAEIMQTMLTSKYFDNWAKHAGTLGGQPPIIKYLINNLISEYPISVRAPLQQITPEIIKNLNSQSA
jgi:dihydrodipicolinate synthase/N-acetylneuraminate lyase